MSTESRTPPDLASSPPSVAPSLRDSFEGSAEGFAGRFGIWIAGVWLVFLVKPFLDHWPPSTVAEVLALVSLLAFSAVYLWAFRLLKRAREVELRTELPLAQGLGLVALLGALNLAEYPGMGEDALGGIIYVAATAAMVLPSWAALAVVLVVSGASALAVATVPGWTDDFDFPVFALMGAFLLWAVKEILARNVGLVRMRQENEALLLEQERNRFARDLHDILGHSLTLIAVKAELAGRLLEGRDARAADEVADLERLSRDALADVRRAVQGYREITLPGELARARRALVAAGIEAHVPTSGDDVVGDLRELFAWTIREGVTNVLRHSTARRCEIDLTADCVVVRNDGVGRRADGSRAGSGSGSGSVGHAGSGLDGLRERALAAGARMRAGQQGEEFVLEVDGS